MNRTIFLIHGMWGDPWYWENYIHFFENRGYRCIAPTLRHHHPGPPHPNLGNTSLLDFVSDLETELQELDNVPILIGYSMGGLLAQILGSRGFAKALILLNPAPPAGILMLTPSVIHSFWSIFFSWGFWKNPIRQKFEEAAYSTLNLLPPDEQKSVFDRFVYESGRATTEMGLWILDPKHAAKVDGSKVKCPILVVGCTQDRIVPTSITRKVAQKYGSQATYKEFTNHAHFVIAEPGWQEVASYVAEWLEKVLAN